MREIELEGPMAFDGARPDAGRSRPGAGRLRWVAALGCLTTFVAGAVAVAVHQSPPSADAALAQAQAVVQEATSYSYEVRTTTHAAYGDPDGAGSESTDRTLTVGTIAGPDRWRVLEDLGDGYGDLELRRVDGDLYLRSSGDPSQVGPPWLAQVAPVDEPTAEDIAQDVADSYRDDLEASEEYGDDDPAYRLQLALSAYLVSLQSVPTGLDRVLLAAEEPKVEEQLADGGLRLRIQLPPLPEVAEVDPDLAPLDGTVDLAPDGTPRAAHLAAAVEGASATIDVAFAGWGALASVERPAEDEIDRTPWIAEEALSQVGPELLVAPASLPEGWALGSALVYDDWEEMGESESCAAVELSYTSMHDGDPFEGIDEDDEEAMSAAYDAMGYLTVSVNPPDCGYAEDGFRETFAGLPSDGLDDGMVDVLVGGVIVDISSQGLSDAEVEALVRSLAPTTVEALAAAVPEWAQTSSGGFWFSSSPGALWL